MLTGQGPSCLRHWGCNRTMEPGQVNLKFRPSWWMNTVLSFSSLPYAVTSTVSIWQAVVQSMASSS